MATLDRMGYVRSMIALSKTQAELKGESFDSSPENLEKLEEWFKVEYDFLDAHGYYIGRRNYDQSGVFDLNLR